MFQINGEIKTFKKLNLKIKNKKCFSLKNILTLYDKIISKNINIEENVMDLSHLVAIIDKHEISEF